MLVIDVDNRVDVEMAIHHPYVEIWFDPNEIKCSTALEIKNSIKKLEFCEQTVDEWKSN